MKVKDIFFDSQTKAFVVTDQDDENELNWIIEPTEFELLPEEENLYFVKAYRIFPDHIADCYLGIVTPERIAEIVVIKTSDEQIEIENIYDARYSVIPAVASECFGNYELFYSKENPKVGIDVLRYGLTKAKNKNIVAEDLGYILRDEGCFTDAVEAFKISEANGSSSHYIYLELSNLYKQLGQMEDSLKYEEKFKEGELR